MDGLYRTFLPELAVWAARQRIPPNARAALNYKFDQAALLKSCFASAFHFWTPRSHCQQRGCWKQLHVLERFRCRSCFPRPHSARYKGVQLHRSALPIAKASQGRIRRRSAACVPVPSPLGAASRASEQNGVPRPNRLCSRQEARAVPAFDVLWQGPICCWVVQNASPTMRIRSASRKKDTCPWVCLE